MDIRQSREYASFLKKQNWQVKKISGIYIFIKKFPLLGNFIKIQRPNSLPPSLFTSLRENYSPFQIIIEPNSNITTKQLDNLKSRGYKLSKSPYLPSKTLILNINKTHKSLLNNLHKDVRYSLKKSEDSLLFTDPNLKSFHKSWKKARKLYQYVPTLSTIEHLQDSFQSSSLFLASHNVKTEQKTNTNYINFDSGAIFLISNSICYYWQAFSSPTGRASLLSYRLLWEGILWAKSQGVKLFDFEGIYDPRFPTNSWLGFTHFKKKFGGIEKSFPGAYTKIFLPWQN